MIDYVSNGCKLRAVDFCCSWFDAQVIYRNEHLSLDASVVIAILRCRSHYLVGS